MDKYALVRVQDYIPTLYVELKYATADNFTGQVIYNFTDAYLRRGTVAKLANAQALLLEQGYSLKVWDAFRPVAAQFALWAVCPDDDYVSDPTRSYSSHSRGNAVDLTLVRSDGTAVEMPSGFDDFTGRGSRDYSGAGEAAAAHARAMEQAMQAAGFRCYFKEWWHFSDPDVYEVEKDFIPPQEKKKEL